MTFLSAQVDIPVGFLTFEELVPSLVIHVVPYLIPHLVSVFVTSLVLYVVFYWVADLVLSLVLCLGPSLGPSLGPLVFEYGCYLCWYLFLNPVGFSSEYLNWVSFP